MEKISHLRDIDLYTGFEAVRMGNWDLVEDFPGRFVVRKDGVDVYRLETRGNHSWYSLETMDGVEISKFSANSPDFPLDAFREAREFETTSYPRP